jgi:outer membrane protease
MMARIGACLLACVTTVAAAGAAAAGDRNFDLWLRSGILRGDSTYTIGGTFADNQGDQGEIRDPLSELKWPLDVVVASLGGQAEAGRFSLRGEVMKNATDNAGDMEDSDWGVYYDLSDGDPAFSPYSKDVFSTSGTDLDLLILDVRGRYSVVQGPQFSATVGLGLRYQKFSLVASDVHQYSPTFYTYGLDGVFTSDPFAADVSGPGIDYEVTYTIPFAELSVLYRFGAMLRLEGSLGYSPFVQASDRDDHLLRQKLSEGSDTGSAWLLDLTLRLQATKHWFAAGGVSGLFIDPSGTQQQSYYGGEYVGYQATLDQTLRSSQICSSLEVGFSF